MHRERAVKPGGEFKGPFPRPQAPRSTPERPQIVQQPQGQRGRAIEHPVNEGSRLIARHLADGRDFDLIPDDAGPIIPGAASEKQQLEIESHRRRVLMDRIPQKATQAQALVRDSLHKPHPIQLLGDSTLEHLQKHVEPYIDSD